MVTIGPGYQLELFGIDEDDRRTPLVRAVLMDDGSLYVPPDVQPGLFPEKIEPDISRADGVAYVFTQLNRFAASERMGARILNEVGEIVPPAEYRDQYRAFWNSRD